MKYIIFLLLSTLATSSALAGVTLELRQQSSLQAGQTREVGFSNSGAPSNRNKYTVKSLSGHEPWMRVSQVDSNWHQGTLKLTPKTSDVGEHSLTMQSCGNRSLPPLQKGGGGGFSATKRACSSQIPPNPPFIKGGTERLPQNSSSRTGGIVHADSGSDAGVSLPSPNSDSPGSAGS